MVSNSIALTALLCGLLPMLAINSNYLIAASEGYVPWCVPYWDSCTSISATGRQGTAFFFFKITMTPLAFLYLRYWYLCNKALNSFGYRKTTIWRLGITAFTGLLVYTLALGAVGDNFQLTRRIGIIFYFSLTYLNQLLLVYHIYKFHIDDNKRHWQLGLCILILTVGLLTLVLDVILENYDDYEDAFEWILGLLIHLNFIVAFFGWRNIVRHNLDKTRNKNNKREFRH